MCIRVKIPPHCISGCFPTWQHSTYVFSRAYKTWMKTEGRNWKMEDKLEHCGSCIHQSFQNSAVPDHTESTALQFVCYRLKPDTVRCWAVFLASKYEVSVSSSGWGMKGIVLWWRFSQSTPSQNGWSFSSTERHKKGLERTRKVNVNIEN